MPRRVERIEFFRRLLEKLDWSIAGLLGSVAAAGWCRDDLISRKAWAVFIFLGAVCVHYLASLVSAYFGIDEPRSEQMFFLSTIAGTTLFGSLALEGALHLSCREVDEVMSTLDAICLEGEC